MPDQNDSHRVDGQRLDNPKSDTDPTSDDSLHPGEDTAAEKHDPDPTEHPIQPAGQATSPASDAQAKDHQRTGDPEADADEIDPTVFDSGATQRIVLTLPKGLVERIDGFQETHGLPSRGHAVAALMANAPDTSDTPNLSDTPPAIAPQMTSSGVHRNY